MLPVPAQARRIGGVGAVRAAVEQVNPATIVWAEAIDL
jgi:hypothetical protein